MKNKLKISATLIIIFIAMIQSLYSQNYLITFSGSGQSTTVETVEVKNIDQQTTLTLSGTDTLLLTDVVGTGYLPSLNQGMSIYPNPANHASRMEFYNPSAGNISIEVYDFSGRLIISKSIQLNSGSHAFNISGLNAGIYLVKINTPENIYSQRLVSTSALRLDPALQHEGINQNSTQKSDLKSISNIVAMQYNDGERLVIKAISGDFAHTKSLIPTQSQNIDFEFMDCIDGDGNHYGVVTIGEQVWMAENLKHLPSVAGPDSGASTMPHYYVYGYDGTDVNAAKSTANYQNYGVLYNWLAALWGCPSGWHLPSDDEWSQMVHYLVAQGFPNEDVVNGVGNALKSCRQLDSPMGGDCNNTLHPRWDSHNTHHGFDAFGFSGLPGGFRYTGEAFHSLGEFGHWWSSTDYTFFLMPWYRYINHNSGKMHSNILSKASGFSVRCVRDN